jgi:hypothetical protein
MDGIRIVGRKAILVEFEKRYGITSWSGALAHIHKHSLPMRRMESGKPFFYLHELDRYDELSECTI